MTLAHRIQLATTTEQNVLLSQYAGTARFVYNWALAEWNEQYKMGGCPKASELKRYFNTIKYEKFPWLKEMPRDTHSQPFANLSKAWAAHFESIRKFKRGEIAKSKIVRKPSFKKKGKLRDSFYIANDKLVLNGSLIRLPVLGWISLTEEFRFHGKINAASVSREADRWFIAISVEMPDYQVAAPVGAPIAIDLGIKTFAQLSTGEAIIAPKPLKRAQKKLGRLQRQEARRRKNRSKRHAKSKLAVAWLHARIKNVRNDFIHKFTTNLAKNHSEIVIEDLNVAGMLKNHKLAFHIQDAAWGETRRQLTYKTLLYGSKLTVRERFYPSSKLCSCCGAKNDALKLSDRFWTCANCGTYHDRDENASQNLLIDPRTAGRRELTPEEREALALGLGSLRETSVAEPGINNDDSLVFTC